MSFADPRDISGNGEGQPATRAFSIAPSDTSDLIYNTRAVYVGGAGNLTVRMYEGDIVVYPGLLAGLVYPFRVNKVYATGTTATNLVGLL